MKPPSKWRTSALYNSKFYRKQPEKNLNQYSLPNHVLQLMFPPLHPVFQPAEINFAPPESDTDDQRDAATCIFTRKAPNPIWTENFFRPATTAAVHNSSTPEFAKGYVQRVAQSVICTRLYCTALSLNSKLSKTNLFRKITHVVRTLGEGRETYDVDADKFPIACTQEPGAGRYTD